MKLLYCPECRDIVVLYQRERTCLCGNVAGWYTDRVNAKVSSNAIVLGIDNISFSDAIAEYVKRPEISRTFEAFTIGSEAASVHRGE